MTAKKKIAAVGVATPLKVQQLKLTSKTCIGVVARFIGAKIQVGGIFDLYPRRFWANCKSRCGAQNGTPFVRDIKKSD